MSAASRKITEAEEALRLTLQDIGMNDDESTKLTASIREYVRAVVDDAIHDLNISAITHKSFKKDISIF